ncbi:hypothetical protein [Dehalogenimonas etheniformans]|uniref:Uncharacterized protein n=1 Tax=Dehalogenimonas etheniformans TaxID=1536648 RepID=A0A2P5P521_9CHLR|nr:hypothetical protein [Dehalogenimonas etheniformans]PPD57391.1 hypothetical protein JP09_010160 [Dehalogenimonas etheniformans]QNT75242.1 hypothetical protein HX448_00305 [Dehalogenimonas etheniformans]
MLGTKIVRVAAVAVLAVSLLLASGCDSVKGVFDSKDDTSTTTALPVTSMPKPKPVVKSVEATTSGMDSHYYAILEITIENKGSDGTVIVRATLTQGGVTQTNDMITNLDKDKTQTLPLVFPLKWQGGDWTQTVDVIVP